MKRIASLLFLLILLLNLVGGYIYFGIRIMQLHDEKRAELKGKDVSELEVITLSLKKFKKALVEEDEMELDNKMYDIARTDIKGDTIIIYCLHDEDEDNLLSLLDSILSNSTKDKKPVPSQIGQLFSAILPGNVYPLACAIEISITHKSSHHNSISQHTTTLDSPPPQQV